MGSFRLDRGQIEVVDDIVAEILRRKTPAERIRIAYTTNVQNLEFLLSKNHHSLSPASLENTEGSERTDFCLSGDTDKQKISAR